MNKKNATVKNESTIEKIEKIIKATPQLTIDRTLKFQFGVQSWTCTDSKNKTFVRTISESEAKKTLIEELYALNESEALTKFDYIIKSFVKNKAKKENHEKKKAEKAIQLSKAIEENKALLASI